MREVKKMHGFTIEEEELKYQRGGMNPGLTVSWNIVCLLCGFLISHGVLLKQPHVSFA